MNRDDVDERTTTPQRWRHPATIERHRPPREADDFELEEDTLQLVRPHHGPVLRLLR